LSLSANFAGKFAKLFKINQVKRLLIEERGIGKEEGSFKKMKKNGVLAFEHSSCYSCINIWKLIRNQNKMLECPFFVA
jgi:hypothetical protein